MVKSHVGSEGRNGPVRLRSKVDYIAHGLLDPQPRPQGGGEEWRGLK